MTHGEKLTRVSAIENSVWGLYRDGGDKNTLTIKTDMEIVKLCLEIKALLKTETPR